MRYAAMMVLALAVGFTSACGGGGGGPVTATPRGAASATVSATDTPTATPTRASVVAGSETPGSAATATPLPGMTTGIRGLVTIGPTCPVERPQSPCPDRPYEATIQVLDAGGTVMAEVRSDAEGRFEVEVAAGTYTLHPVTGPTPPSARDQEVTVREGEVTEVRVQFDSGIR